MLKENIKRNEGFVDHIYKDTLGYDTVGYGFKCKSLSPDELACNNGKYEPMSIEVAEQILDIKIMKLKNTVFKNIPWLVDYPLQIQDAICEMTYQMGMNGVLGFKNTLNLIKQRKFVEAADNMLKSKWAKQTPNRAKYVSNLVRTAH